MARTILLFCCCFTRLMWLIPVICSWLSTVNSEQSSVLYEPIGLGAYDSYGSVWLEAFDIPEAATSVEWTFMGSQSDARCQLRNMHVSLQKSGFPVISPEGHSFPDHFHLDGSGLINISLTSNSSLVQYVMQEPPSGLWFLAAYRDGQESVVKKVTSISCDYAVAYNITMTNMPDVEDVPVTSDGTSMELTLSKHTMMYRFRTTELTWSSVLRISDCTTNGTILDPCPLTVLARAEALPSEDHADSSVDCMNATQGGVCTAEVAAAVKAYTYVRLHRATEDPLTVKLAVANRECGLLTTPLSPLITDDPSCPDVRKMVRIIGSSQVYEVVYALNATERMFVENIAKVLDNYARIFQFDVVPMMDSGGTLRLRAEFNNTFENHTEHTVNVTLCLKLGRIPVSGMNVSCDPGDTMTLSSSSNDSREMVVRYDPYPRAGSWYLVMQSLCYKEDPQKGVVIVSCGFGEVSVRFDLIVTACVDGGCSDGGSCTKYLSGTLIYSACDCDGGLKGYGCTDSSGAYPSDKQMTFTLLLTLSNLFFLPAIAMATYKQYYVEALVYFFNMFFSSFYHACDMSQWSTYTLCIMPYNVLSFCDFFCSVISIWVTLIAMAALKPPLSTLAHTLGMFTLAMGVEWDRHNFLVNTMPAIVGLVIVAVSWSVRCRRRKECYPSRSQWLKLIPGFLLAGTGIAIFGLVETDQNYPYTHSVWHVVMALSILCLLPSQQRRYSGHFLSLESSNDSLMEELGQPVEVVGLMTANSRMTQAASTSMDNDDVVLLD